MSIKPNLEANLVRDATHSLTDSRLKSTVSDYYD